MTATMVATAYTLERGMRIKIHVTEGQRAALSKVLDGAPDAGTVQISGFTVAFEMQDPIGWLEARMAEHPRGRFPRASLHSVLRRLAAAIQGQVQPDREPPGTP